MKKVKIYYFYAMKEKKVKVIPEGLKGDGTFVEEEYGYQMKRKRSWRKTKRNRSLRKRNG